MGKDEMLRRLLREFTKISKNGLCKEITVKTLESEIVIKDEKILREAISHFISLILTELRKIDRKPIYDGCDEEEDSSL